MAEYHIHLKHKLRSISGFICYTITYTQNMKVDTRAAERKIVKALSFSKGLYRENIFNLARAIHVRVGRPPE